MAMTNPSWSALLTPGRKLMDRLSLSGKFSVVAGIIALPVVLLTWLYFHGLSVDLASARDEYNGGRMFAPAVQLLDALQDHSAASGRLLTGENMAADAVKQSDADGRKALAAVQAFDHQFGDEFGTHDAMAATTQAAELILGSDAPKDAAANRTAHDQAITAVRQLIEHLYEGSGIVLDPVAPTYFLGNATADASVAMLQALGAVRVQGMKVITLSHADNGQRAALGAAAERVRFNRDRFVHEIQAAGADKGPDAVALNKAVADMNDGVDRLLSSLQDQIIVPADIDIDTSFFDHKGAHAIRVAQVAEEASLAQFNRAITERLVATQRQMAIAAVALTALLLAVGYLFFAFRSGVLRSVRAIAEGAGYLTTGDLDQAVAVSSDDEFAEIAKGVNDARSAVQMLVRSLDEMCRRHARDGEIDWYPVADGVRGAYRDLVGSVCDLTRDHVDVTMKTVALASRYADGDFSADMERLPGKRGEISAAMDRVKASFMSVSDEILRLAEAAAAGDFSARGDADRYRFELRRSVEALNRLMQVSGDGLRDAASVMSAVAEGDLTARMNGDYRGTFADLQRDLNATVDRLREIVGEIRGATSQIHTGASEIAKGNADLSSRTERQAAHLEETAASTEQLSSTVKRNAEHSQQAHRLTTATRDLATNSGSVVAQMVETMRGINDSAGRISEIVTLIDGIAFQTNILALNAAVEAARAGEQGRGFAVVAAEVRSLAQRCAAAARDVKGLIEESTAKVTSGSKLVDDAGRKIEEVVNSVRKVADIVGEINGATREQAAGIDQVAKTVTELDDHTQRNAALVEQASAAAEELEGQARGLSEMVARFRLEASDSRGPVGGRRKAPTELQRRAA